MNESNNKEQIKAFFRGEEQVIQALYNNLFPKVELFVLQNKGSLQDAKEVFHKVLYQLMIRNKVKKVVINTKLEAYIYTSCKFSWYQEIKDSNKRVRNEGIFELKDESTHHLDDIIQQERWRLFDDMFTKLSESCQQLLRDFFDKVSYDAIKEKFHYSTKNVAFQRIFKCKMKLTELIQADKRYKNL